MVAGRAEAREIAAEKPKGVRMLWTFEVIDKAKVPIEYLYVDEQVVRQAITGKDGLREIPGLRIFEKPSVSL
jgi:hypothetical protein